MPSLTWKLCCSYKAFCKQCPSGQLDKENFRQMFQKFFQFRDPDEFADHLFDVFDKDKNGRVDFKEFICALSMTLRGSLEDKAKCTPRSADSGLV